MQTGVMRRRLVCVALIVAVGLASGACTDEGVEEARESLEGQAVPVAITRPADGNLLVHLPPCDPYDDILNLGLFTRSESERIWGIENTGAGEPLTTIEVGVVPTGYEALTDDSALSIVDDQELRLVVLYEPEGFTAEDIEHGLPITSIDFAPGDVPEDGVLVDGEQTTLEEFETSTCG